MVNYKDTLNHYRGLLAQAWGMQPEDIVFLSELQTDGVGNGVGGDGIGGVTGFDEEGSGDWVDRHLREAANHIALVRLYQEYGSHGDKVVRDSLLQDLVLDQAIRIVAWSAQDWDNVESYATAFYEAEEWNDEDGGDGEGGNWGLEWSDGDDG